MTGLTTFPLAHFAHCGSQGCNKRVGSHHYCSPACMSAGPAEPQSGQQETEMPRGKKNGHDESDALNVPTVSTDDAAPAIVARMAIDALEADKIEGLRDWLRDNVGTADEVLQSINRWDTDPEGMRRELQNTLTFHLTQDDGATNDLTEILNGKRSALPPPPTPRQAEAEKPASTTEAAIEGEADEPEAELLSAPAGPTPRVAAPRSITLSARKLKGELVAYMLELLRLEQDADRRPWNQRPEAHQRAVIARVNERVEEALRGGFMVMLGERPRVIGGVLDSVTAKEDGIKAVIKVSTAAENLVDLLTGAGERVQIAIADPNAFMGMGDGIPVTLDQTVLPLTPEPDGDPEPQAADEPAQADDAEGEDLEAPPMPPTEEMAEHAVH